MENPAVTARKYLKQALQSFFSDFEACVRTLGFSLQYSLRGIWTDHHKLTLHPRRYPAVKYEPEGFRKDLVLVSHAKPHYATIRHGT